VPFAARSAGDHDLRPGGFWLLRSPRTDAHGQCEFRYQPEGWGQAYRFIVLRYEKKPNAGEAEREQYQLFDTPEYTYRVFVTDMDRAIELLAWF